jgi:hypothetical protein
MVGVARIELATPAMSTRFPNADVTIPSPKFNQNRHLRCRSLAHYPFKRHGATPALLRICFTSAVRSLFGLPAFVCRADRSAWDWFRSMPLCQRHVPGYSSWEINLHTGPTASGSGGFECKAVQYDFS